MSDPKNLMVFPDPDALAISAAEFIVRAARDAIDQRGRFTLALAGGSTPEKTYRRLASSEMAGKIDWSKSYLFMGDERFVPAADPASNFGMAQRSLLNHVPVPKGNVFPVPTESRAVSVAAQQYHQTLARFFGQVGDTAPPRFDLILLGLGDDGHIASLFPGMPSLVVDDCWVTWSPPGTLPPPVDRVTMTFPVLNHARSVLFLVAGDKKSDVLHEILEGHPSVQKPPAAGIRPVAGTVTWLLDKAAASNINSATDATLINTDAGQKTDNPHG